MKLLYLFFLLFLFLQLSCKDNSTNPPSNNNPPGYQEDIPWPSLADSPWPMYRGDPQNTGRSKWSAAVNGNIAFLMDTIWNTTGAAVGSEGVFYIVNMENYPGLSAVNQAGEVLWNYRITGSRISSPASPLITSQGNICFSSPGDKKLITVDKDGNLLWEVNDIIVQQTGINIDKAGNIYCVSQGKLYCISQSGEILWTLDGNFFGTEGNSMAFSPDGNTLYIPGIQNEASVIAVDINNKTIKWKFGNITDETSPLVDSYGNIYTITDQPGKFYCLNPEGEILWSYDLMATNCCAFKAIDKNGNLYIGIDSLIVLDYQGNFKWSHNRGLFAPPVISADGSVFILMNDETPGIMILNKFSSDGSISWSLNLGSDFRAWYSPAIFHDGILIPSFRDSKLALVK